MKLRRRDRVNVSVGLMLTPMLDMLTVVLIFLILNFSPEKSAINKTDAVHLPKAEIQLTEVPRIKIEVRADAVLFNGNAIAGLNPQATDANLWNALKEKITEISEGNTSSPVLLMADQNAEYDQVDRTVARLASMGYSDIYLLTELEEKK